MPILKRYKKNKFGAKPTKIDGHRFASKAESKRYLQLKNKELIGEIKDVILQPKFELQPKFKKNGTAHRAITYIADFQYTIVKTKELVIEDVKSPVTATPLYKLKKKLFEYKYPNLSIKEVY